MSDTKHDKDARPPADDLRANPGIGQSKGTFMTGQSPLETEGEDTVNAVPPSRVPSTFVETVILRGLARENFTPSEQLSLLAGSRTRG